MFSFLLSLAVCGSEFYVMAPLDLFNSNQEFTYKDKFDNWLSQLKGANVDGIMIDVWWGLTETSEKNYKWTGYQTAFEMIANKGLKIIPVFSFHKCGGNVGDTCNIPLPSFVTGSSSQPFFVDSDGHVDNEYISFAYDEVKVTSRTPLEMYSDWMSAFKSQFSSFIQSGQIYEIEVGTGPCGEARYPSYQSAYWTYPGCGEFQCYDSQFQKLLVQDANNDGHSDYGHNPNGVGSYNTQPGGSTFWRDDASDGWSSSYGRWFIKWYAAKLNDHTGRVLKVARQTFPSVRLSTKIAGIHWWYMTSSHCAETTAGFNNFYDYDGYRDLISVFKQYNVQVCFTCLEMAEGSYGSNPPYLVQQIINDAKWAGLTFEGENALSVYDSTNYGRIKSWVSKGLQEFTYLRMCDTLFDNYNFNIFKQFVSDMHNA